LSARHRFARECRSRDFIAASLSVCTDGKYSLDLETPSPESYPDNPLVKALFNHPR
jgi:hypothetical protein